MFITLSMAIAMLGRMMIGATLLVAGIGKIQNGHSRFLQSILGYDLVPKWAATLMARWLPWLEVITGVMLIAGVFSQAVAIVAFSLFLIFTIAITVSLIRGMNNDCGCFGHVSPVQWRLVYRDVFLMAVLLPVYAFKGGLAAIDQWVPDLLNLNPVASNDGLVVLLSLWGTIFLVVLLIHRLMQKRPTRVKSAQF